MSTTLGTELSSQGIFLLTLNRPEVHNALDEELIEALIEVLQSIPGDARLLLLKGEGKSFCSGADLGWMKKAKGYDFEENVRDVKKLEKVFSLLSSCPIPTIAFAHGAVMGGGVGLAACCDIVVAHPQTFFSLSEVHIGLIPALISPYIIRSIGEKQALRFFLSGERLTAPEAFQMGLVHRLDESETPMIQQVLKGGPEAQKAAKDLFKQTSQNLAEFIATRRVSEEGQEGLSAFLEKRLPRWASHV